MIRLRIYLMSLLINGKKGVIMAQSFANLKFRCGLDSGLQRFIYFIK